MRCSLDQEEIFYFFVLNYLKEEKLRFHSQLVFYPFYRVGWLNIYGIG